MRFGVTFLLILRLTSEVSGFGARTPATTAACDHRGHVNVVSSSVSNFNPSSKKQTTGLFMSIPNGLDTATSGFASIARLPFGSTVSSSLPSTASSSSGKNYSIKKLYDTEQNKDCRQVRERITELDLVVETVIPSAPNSRLWTDKKASGEINQIPAMVVVGGEEEEQTLVGLDRIMNFLDNVYGPRSAIIVDDVDEIKTRVAEFLVEVGAYIPAIVRSGRGLEVASCALSPNTPRPAKPLILYSYEGNQFCRLVREVLTELDLPYELRSAGKGSPRRAELAEITGGSTTQPFLIDPNGDQNVNISESKEIIKYLYKTYAMFTPPNEILGQVSTIITPILKPIFKTLAPLQAGSNRESQSEYKSELAAAKAEIEKEITSEEVVVYTYSLSPFCTEALQVLDNLGVEYKEISLGKEWLPLLINEGGSQKRMALAEMTGQSSLPHVFIRGKSIGGLYDGLVPVLEDESFWPLLAGKEEEVDEQSMGTALTN